MECVKILAQGVTEFLLMRSLFSRFSEQFMFPGVAQMFQVLKHKFTALKHKTCLRSRKFFPVGQQKSIRTNEFALTARFNSKTHPPFVPKGIYRRRQ